MMSLPPPHPPPNPLRGAGKAWPKARTCQPFLFPLWGWGRGCRGKGPVAQVSSPVEAPGSTGFQPVGTPLSQKTICHNLILKQ
jgi:hypothetical protein